jgi:putative phosphoesterase
MKIGILSDSHGNIENLKRAIEILRKENVKFIVHLGDNYSDCEGLPINIRIPGVYDEEYTNRTIKHRIIKDFGGKKFLFSHTSFTHENDFESDLKPEKLIEEGKIDFLVFGHTHIPEIRKEIINDKEIIFVNPGHLKEYDKKGYPPTFGIIEINEKCAIKIMRLNLEIFTQLLL